jgi:UDP-N-acetylmuramyl tripeptide synthase
VSNARGGACALGLNRPLDDVVARLQPAAMPGRMERIATGRASPATTRTPDALQRARRAPAAHRGRIIAFCGGDRDRTKRPRMAEAVAANADVAIATSDNPRTEDRRHHRRHRAGHGRRAAPRIVAGWPRSTRPRAGARR